MVESFAVDILVLDTLVEVARLVAGSKAAAAGIVRYRDLSLGRWEEGRWVGERHSVLALARPLVLDCVCAAGMRAGDPSWRHPCL